MREATALRHATLLATLVLVLVLATPALAGTQEAALQHAARVPLPGANDFAYRDGIVYMGSLSQGMRIIDVRVPEAPVVLGAVACTSKDLNLVELANGRIVATLASQGNDRCPGANGRGGIRLVDVTVPTAPVVGKQVPLEYGSHTHTPYGNTGLIYNSAYNLLVDPSASPLDHHRSEIVDINEWSAPRVVAEFMFPPTSASIGCHDILAQPERGRTICAAITETQVWDTSDPLAPVVLSTIVNPAISIHHSAAATRGGDLVVIGDEFAGALAPGGCATGGVAPTGALWAYDLATPEAPVPLGYWAPSYQTTGVCTAHTFNFAEGTDTLVAAAYSGGVFAVDFSNPTLPRTLAHSRFADSSAWSAYAFEGLAIVGDTSRGMDVYRLR